MSHGDQPWLSPLTEPYVRVRIRLLFQVISSDLRQDSGFDSGEVEEPQLAEPAIGHGPTRQVTPRITPASHADFQKLALVTQLPQAAVQATGSFPKRKLFGA